MKRVFLIFVCGVLFSQVVPKTVADVTGDGSAHAVATSGTARWIQFIADPANGAAVRIGDSNITTSRGSRVAAGGGLLWPPVSCGTANAENCKYVLAQVFYLAQTGDKISITWGQ